MVTGVNFHGGEENEYNNMFERGKKRIIKDDAREKTGSFLEEGKVERKHFNKLLFLYTNLKHPTINRFTLSLQKVFIFTSHVK